MNSLPRIKESNDDLKKVKKQIIYEYFNARVSKSVIEGKEYIFKKGLIKSENDDRYIYFLRYGIIRRVEGDGDMGRMLVEARQGWRPGFEVYRASGEDEMEVRG